MKIRPLGDQFDAERQTDRHTDGQDGQKDTQIWRS